MLKEEALDICEKLLSKQAHFYVCGDVKMADDVCKTLQVISELIHHRFNYLEIILAETSCLSINAFILKLPEAISSC